ncbi:hypothetical protein FA13DRAFT_1796309 [Coprinellus micaceus]|uniref:Uncharacterized protein n=1 Tax=Coprinellus micaceus TaxID=71717 RepID=A0A4Y7SWI4_COPMI|nr:hypothetical protein FA13DRAFT_1796309 [Coprinellus micaceus]
MDPYMFPPPRQYQNQGYDAGYPFSTPSSDQFGPISIKMEPGSSTYPHVPSLAPVDAQMIAVADHDTLMHVKNIAYMELWNSHQSAQASLQTHKDLLVHYSTLLQACTAPYPPGMPGTSFQPSAAVMPFGSGDSDLHRHVPINSTTVPGTCWPFPIHELPPPLSQSNYPNAKWWYQKSWKGQASTTINRGEAKPASSTSTDVDDNHGKEVNGKRKKSKDGNKRLFFLTDENGVFISKTLLDQMSTSFFDILNDVQRAIGTQMPFTYTVAGETFKNHLRYSMLKVDKYRPVFTLCDNLWKFEQYTTIKYLIGRAHTSRMFDDEPDSPPAKKPKIKKEPLPSPPPLANTSSPKKAVSSSSAVLKTAMGSSRPNEAKPKVLKKYVVAIFLYLSAMPLSRVGGTLSLSSKPIIPPVDKSIVIPLKTAPAPPQPAETVATTKGAKPKSTKKKKQVAASTLAVPKPTKAELAAAKNAKPTTGKQAKNLYLIDYIKEHGEVTIGQFDKIWDDLDIQTKLEYERRSVAARETSKAGAQAKRVATVAAKAKAKSNASRAKGKKKDAPVPEQEESEDDDNEEESGFIKMPTPAPTHSRLPVSVLDTLALSLSAFRLIQTLSFAIGPFQSLSVTFQMLSDAFRPTQLS